MEVIGNDPGLPQILDQQREEALIRLAEELAARDSFHGNDALTKETLRDAMKLRWRGQISYNSLQQVFETLSRPPLVLEFPSDPDPKAA